ncbi:MULTISPECIES: FKBP-type peptidyl-prolyl cis-trans isomerase [Nocardia]|uniref:FKBP-type peptidyl-prolyl cis-trans isomerase n=1 Tax=Nocardia TaxID=1817 RepID=UPI00135C6974|nr:MULTISPECIES: FKBP-type peptidyl-prolyl cis-trans isomerase [Nocardia]
MGVAEKITSPGDGVHFPQPGQLVVMHCTGRLEDGTKFDSSRDRNKPFEARIGVGSLIKGWDEAIPTMSKGERATLTITPDYGYGAKGAGHVVRPNATLVFDVELIESGDHRPRSGFDPWVVGQNPWTRPHVSKSKDRGLAQWRGGRMNRLRRLTAALCAAPMAILALSSPSAQADNSWATGPVVGAAGKCMAVSGSGSADRTPIVLADCTGAVNQQWVVQPDGSLTVFGKCLGLAGSGTGIGTLTHLYTCNATKRQQWRSDGSRLRNVQTGKCLDIVDGSTDSGARLQIWECHEGANQKWSLPRTGPVIGPGGKCMDVYEGSDAAGTPIVLWPCLGGANQRWTVNADGTLQILGKCLDVDGGATKNGTRVQLWPCNGAEAQRWEKGGTATRSTLRNPQSGRCLDAKDVSDGTQLRIWDCHGQPWRLPAYIK